MVLVILSIEIVYESKKCLVKSGKDISAGTGSGGHDPHAGSDGNAGANQHVQRQLLCDGHEPGADGGGRIWGSPSV